MQQKPFTASRRRITAQCPRCGHLVGVRSKTCLNCGLPFPSIYSQMPLLGDLIRGQLFFSDGIVLACFALFVLALALNISQSITATSLFSALAPTHEALYRLGMGGVIPLAQGRWWSLLMATYLHGGVLHIAFNMLWLRQIGPLVEELYGPSRFFILYTLAGLLGSVVSVIAGTSFFVGASGAIYGLFGALIYYGWKRGCAFGTAIFRRMLFWAAIGFFLGLVGSGIDNWAHLGGFVGGFVLAILLKYQERSRQSFFHHLLAALVLIGVVVCFACMMVAYFRA